MSGSKKWYIYTMEYFAAERKKELLPYAIACMELESIMLSEISQVVKDKCYIISPLVGPNQQTNEQNRTKVMKIKNKLTVTRGEDGEG